MDNEQLNGLRVLVVEDEAAISMLLEDMLLDFGCTIVGPAARLSVALDLAKSESFDLAILDHAGPIVDVVNRMDPSIDAVVSGHTHQAYNCEVNGKLVTLRSVRGGVVPEMMQGSGQ